MKNLLSTLRSKLSFVGLAPFLFIALGSTAFGSSYSRAAISFLEESHLSISDEAKKVLISCVSNDRNSTGWTAEIKSEDTVYAVETLSIPKAQVKSVQNSNNDSAMRRSLSRATLRLAVFLDNGKLDRKRFSNHNAANYALLMSYRGRIKGGIQSFSKAIGDYAVSLVWVKRENVKADNTAKSETQLADDYCKYLYKTATDLFNAGKYDEALQTFHQIHYMSWANTSAYLGASACFLEMKQNDDAIKLASELVNVFSKDMTPDEMASAGKILFEAGEKDKGFGILGTAYKMLKSGNSKIY